MRRDEPRRGATAARSGGSPLEKCGMDLRQPGSRHLVCGELLLEQPREDVADSRFEMIGKAERRGPRDIEAGVPLAGVGLLDKMGEPRGPHLLLAVDRPRHRRQSGARRIDLVGAYAQAFRRRLVAHEPIGSLQQGAERDLGGEPPAALAGAAIATAQLVGRVDLGPRTHSVHRSATSCQSRMWLRMWSGTAARR